MDRIVSGIRDGLGNQLFQFASGYALAQNVRVPFDLDVTWYNDDSGSSTNRTLLVDKIVPRESYRFLLQSYTKSQLARDRLRRLSRLSTSQAFRFGVPIFPVTPLDVKPISKIAIPSYIQGFPFDYRDFISAVGDLLPQISHLIGKASSVTKPSSEYAFVHVRRGDHLDNPHYAGRYVLLGREYFQPAMEAYETARGKTTWIVCSDSPTEAMKVIPSDFSAMPSHGKSELDDLWIMLNAAGGVISNSTFSFWGAFLNRSGDAHFIAPKRWRMSGEPGIPLPCHWRRL